MHRKLVDQLRIAPSGFLAELVTSETFKTIAFDRLKLGNASVEEIVHAIAKCGDVSDSKLVNDIEIACLLDLDEPLSDNRKLTVNVIHYCCVFYENTGQIKKTLESANEALKHAYYLGDQSVIQRSHNLIAQAYEHNGDYNDALEHIRKSYKIAVEADDLVARFMTLITSALILESMGLIKDSHQLALRLSRSYPLEGAKLACLHLCNATNGMLLSHSLCDMDSAEEFYVIASEAALYKSCFLTDLNLANYDAARIVHFALRGEYEKSDALAKSATSRALQKQNLRALVMIACAQASSGIVCERIEDVQASQIYLESMLVATKELGNAYSDILQTLLKIDAFLSSYEEKSAQRSSHYYSLLKVHSLSVQHREFFLKTIKDFECNQFDNIRLENPSYNIPVWLQAIASGREDIDANKTEDSSSNSCIRRIPTDILNAAAYTYQEASPSALLIAENWAIAVECAMGSDGFNGLRVSRLSAAIARELHNGEECSSMLESACRVYDIGRVVLTFANPDYISSQALGRFSLFSQHTTIGARILNQAQDQRLKLAASIAESHHEWWNGFGYPKGLKAFEIPVEARICAVADAAVSFMCPSNGQSRWELSAAVAQIKTMAGVQFDPTVCAALERVFTGNEYWWIQSFRSENCLRGFPDNLSEYEII